MVTDTSLRILNYIAEKEEASPKELAVFLGISSQALFKQLHKLLGQGKIDKVGTPPVVFYRIHSEEQVKVKKTIDSYLASKDCIFQKDTELASSIEDNFLYITPQGDMKTGIEGFLLWCVDKSRDFNKTASEYKSVTTESQAFYKNGFIDATDKMIHTFKTDIRLDGMYYLDFYVLKVFGKTKLGMLLLYGKQNQDIAMMRQVISAVEVGIYKFVKQYDIGTIVFVPPTIYRNVQFMKELDEQLRLPLARIQLKKAKGEVSVAQKTLSSLKDRIENAKNTIFIASYSEYIQPSQGKNILVIDDAVGSGATINEIARKITEKGLKTGKIYGLAITGSMNGFEVINEV